ncbi:MAG: PrsW family intramembrane metalloprotease [Nitrospinae bacterium]|nr:PrsW family intramembrane metalloprotease [Nitrospinota bacterium]
MNGGIETLKLIYLAVGPGIALAVYIYYSARWNPKPKKLVIKCFIWGALAVFPTMYYEETFVKILGWEGSFNDTWWQTVIYAFFGVALAEEVCKFFFLKEFIYEDPNFNDPFDGIVYGGMIGCGFATMENLMYVVSLGYETGILRMLTAVPAHAFDGIILGYFMGKAKFSSTPWKHLTRGLVTVIILHGTYDSVAMSNLSWSIYPLFGIVIFGIYLALKVKRELEKTSKRIEFSSGEYFLPEDVKKKEPLLLKDIRDKLSEGSLKLDDILVPGKSDRRISIRTLWGSQIGLEARVRAKTPPRVLPAKRVVVFYGLTFGLYLYFWFHRNYRNFKDYKNLSLNPDLRTLGLFVFTIIPFFVYGAIPGEWKRYSFDPSIEISFNVMMAGIEAAFLYFLFRMIREILNKEQKKSFPILSIVLMFFVLSGMRKFLPSELPYYWWFEFALILLQGGVLAVAQKHLNAYWALEREKLAEST